MATDTRNIHETKQALFLGQLSQHGLPARAAKAIGCINASQFYKKRAKDPEFAAQWQAAVNEFAERIEAEAYRRAVQGVSKPVVYQGGLTYLYETDTHGRVIFDLVDDGAADPKTGEPTLTKLPRPQRNPDGTPKVLALQEYSDTLLLALLKAKCVGYKDRVEIANAPGQALKVEESPIVIARQVAFALALGLKEAERQKASGEDLA